MAVLSHVFIDMLGLGVTIVTGMDRKVYSNESAINNPMDLMHSIMLCQLQIDLYSCPLMPLQQQGSRADQSLNEH